MNWLERIIPPKIKRSLTDRAKVPEGVWRRCDGCKAMLYAAELEKTSAVCPKCGHHHRIGANQRLLLLLDEGTVSLIGEEVLPDDSLRFKDLKRYKDRLSDASKHVDGSEALIAASGEIKGMPVVVAAFEFDFMGGSMGAVVGERFVRAATFALENKRPFICFSASGGARMQEGLFSLMQLSKTVAALKRLKQAGVPYVSVLTDPTMGGVSASFAMLGDIILAEPGALIGFAGPRVIKETVRETLPEGFQRAEFLFEHGAIDMIVARPDMRDKLHHLISLLYPASFETADEPETTEVVATA